jgi:hypothetical protein
VIRNVQKPPCSSHDRALLYHNILHKLNYVLFVYISYYQFTWDLCRDVFILERHIKFTGQAVSKGFTRDRWFCD